MPKQVDVLVEDISKDEHGRPTVSFGTRQTLSYKSFLILNDPENPRFNLIGEVDAQGKLVPGNPNLEAQHRQVVQAQSQNQSAAPVVNDGPTQRELELLAEIAKLKAAQGTPRQTVPSDGATIVTITERKKPGPKPKVKPEMEGATV